MSAKASKKKQEYMSDEAFAELMEGLHQVLELEQGKKTEADGYRVTRREVPAPPKPRTRKAIVQIRRRLGHSQQTFALLLNVSKKTVQAWEQGLRQPSDASLRLLAIADKHPEVFFDAE